MSAPADAFAASYAQARRKFLDAARAAGLAVESRIHPEKGREGEELAMDVAREGPPNADKVLILSSACHGIEGLCGSGVQVAALRDPEWRRDARERGIAVLYLHALNPHGFSHLRRVTHENVDLNRNFHDFAQPLPDNPSYRVLHALLLPAEWPPSRDNQQAVAKYIAEHGEQGLQAAVSRGQHEFPDGLFFGGTSPTWSNLALREVLRKHCRGAKRLAWIDLHTGLGPGGLGERIFAGPDDGVSVARARAWWDGGGATPITSIYDGSSTSAYLTGLMWMAAPQECPQAEFTSIALEYGTVPLLEVIQALRGDHWLHLHPQAPRELADSIKQRIRDAFYTDTPEWKQQVVEQAMQALYQSAGGLSA